MTRLLQSKALFTTIQVIALMARLVKYRDVANATLHVRSDEALSGSFDLIFAVDGTF